MKNIIKVEFIKIWNNKFYFFSCLLLLVITVLFTMLIPKTSEMDFIKQQQQEARIMIDAIENSSNIEEVGIKKQKECYKRILIKNDWKSIYQELNILDELFIEHSELVKKHQSDLQYDYKTNIMIREYYIRQNINLFDNIGGIIIKDISYYIFDFLVVFITLLIGLNCILIEYEDKTIKYLFTAPYSYAKIYFGKWITSILTCIIIMGIPIFIVFLLSTLFYGVSDSQILFQVSYQFSNVTINNIPFSTIYNYLGSILLLTLIVIVLVTHVTVSLSLCIKNRMLVVFLTALLVLLFVFYKPILLPTRILGIEYPMGVILITILLLMCLLSVATIYCLRKRDIV